MTFLNNFDCPDVVRGEYNVLTNQVAEFLQDKQKDYADVIPFLSKEKKHLESVRAKIGKDSAPFIMMSSIVVNACLVKIIPEINAEQERLDGMGIQYTPLHYDEFRKLKDIARVSWQAFSIMDRMPMEYQFKEENYLPSRATLKKICEGMGLDTRNGKEKFSDHVTESLDNGSLGCLYEMGVKIGILVLLMVIIVSLIKACN